MVPVKERLDMHRSAFFYKGIIVPGVMEMRFGYWDRALDRFNEITNADSMYNKPEMLYKEALTLFSTGMSAIERNNAGQAEISLNKLDALLWRNSQAEDKESQLEDYWVSFLKVASEELQGNVLVYKGEAEKGIGVLENAAVMEKDLLYAIGEIILVVIGILIALQINNWNEHRKDNFIVYPSQFVFLN